MAVTTDLNATAKARRSLGGRALRETVLTVGAVVGLVCIGAALAGLIFGIKPLVFRSGSMSPQIQTGALALSKTVPATELGVGDVVSVVNDEGTRITHRVDALEPLAGNTVSVTLKGDANDVPDLMPYIITEADRIFFHVNGLGYAVSWLSSPLATFLGGGLVGAVLVLAFAPTGARRDDRSDDVTADDFAEGVHRG